MKLVAGLLAAFVCSSAHASEPGRRTLTFEDRVNAQAAIERVSYAHQIGASLSFEEAMPRAVLERKVRTYLEQSEALALYWKIPVTDEMLQEELERMARGTRMPERLSGLYAALGNDLFLVKECLARETLVDRLTRNFYAFDPALHADARRRAEELHRKLELGELSALADHPDRSVIAFDLDTSPRKGTHRRQLSLAELRERRSQFPGRLLQVSALREVPDGFVFSVVLVESSRGFRAARYAVAKTPWDVWWEAARIAVASARVAAVALDRSPLPSPGKADSGRLDRARALGSALECPSDDSWTPSSTTSAQDAPSGRYDHSSVWTGSIMIVWGGYSSDGAEHVLNTGGRYNPTTDTWTPTSTTGAPSERELATAVWTGSRMVVWGGYDLNAPLDTGGQYDPAADSWTATSTTDAPTARFYQTAVWTGSRMVVWGGGDLDALLDTGGQYDPATDSWTATSTTGAPSARERHTAVWTGARMVVWGGVDSFALDTGGRYDPETDTWTLTSTTGAPAGVFHHTAVWTGSLMIVWGGNHYDGSDHDVNTGGRYNPVTDSWTATSTAGAPSAREWHAAVWTGTRMVVWGGYYFDGSDVFLNTGARYDPTNNAWLATSAADAPTERFLSSAVWTGTQMIVWGGWDGGPANTGGRYNPATNSWTPTFSTATPSGRLLHQAVWTGSLMIVWGGWDGARDLGTGGRYDPATDSWTPTSTTGAPSPREYHTAVWTGSRMVVWGGWDGANDVATGGRYDPATDTWTPTSATGAPSAREAHVALWTGSRMVLWGGYFYDGSVLFRNTGGRYDPTTDSWTAMSTAGAPSVRYGHTAVWTGSVMIVWGGIYFDGAYHFLNTGGRYNPSTDSWTPTSMTAPPLAREGHTAVWTGSRMIVWGGYLFDGADHFLNEGNLYDPTTDSWVPTSTSDAPGPREFHTAVWTGTRMVVWGGYLFEGLDEVLDTGGRYDPATDSWSATTTTGAPTARLDHTAVWAGSSMVVWGGDDLHVVFDAGGRYALGSSVDNDGDGYSVCEGDCNDANPAVHPAVLETCNGIDDDCDHVVDNGGGVLCDDGNDCTADVCDVATGCDHVGVAGACNDGNACTTNDACNGGVCVGGSALNCNDANPCTDDSCDTDDGCVHIDAVACNDGNPCTDDSCDPASGCAHANNAEACDDGNPCTANDACNGGACRAGPPTNCDDANICTDDSCDPVDGCEHADNTASCGDGEVCTADVCDPASGCVMNHRTINVDTDLFSADRVDGRDLVVLADAWNSCSPEPRYNAAADLDPVATPQGACVEASDFHLFMSAFGQNCP